jgi:hypothetical protein
MFTFGRDHEKKCAVEYLRDPRQADLITTVVDAVHDVIEGKAIDGGIRPIVTRAFVEGGTGVWEQTGSWLRRLATENVDEKSLWQELADHADSKVRFRVACFLNDLPPVTAKEVGEKLKNDRSKKVREMAVARLEELST